MPYCLIKAGIAITIWRFQAHTDNIMRKVWNRQILSYVYNVINHKHCLSSLCFSGAVGRFDNIIYNLTFRIRK